MRKAFSLAEVLVTLTILGVIFVCTMPVLNISIRDKQNYTNARKTFTMLGEAMTISTLATFDYSEYIAKNDSDAKMKEWFDRFLKPQLRVMKVCYNKSGCWNPGHTYNLNGSPVYYSVKGVGVGANIITAVLNDGTFINIDSYSKGSISTYFGVDIKTNDGLVVIFDVNGEKGPNMMGKDIFATVFADDVLVPAYSSRTKEQVYNDCKKSGTGYSCLQKMLLDETEL